MGLIPSHFYLILEADSKQRSHSTFVALVIYTAVVVVAISFTRASQSLVTGFLFISWRESLTQALHNKYFSGPYTTYKANDQHAEKDNPDQRIASDASAVCNDLAQVVPVLLVSPFTITYYSYQCWLVTSYLGPVSILAFFLIATIINKLIIDGVARWTYRQERFEGNFRYGHMLVRAHCESSAFFQVHKVEEQQSNESLDSLLGVQEHLMLWKYAQNMFVYLCDYSASILSYVMVSIPIFAGHYDNLSGAALASIVSQYSFKSMTLFNCFTTIIDLSKQAATLLGNSQRVGDFIEALELIDKQSTKSRRETYGDRCPEATSFHSIQADTDILVDSELFDNAEVDSQSSYQMVALDDGGPAIVKLERVTVEIPSTKRVLVSDFTYTFEKEKNVLITGDSGVGKSSLLRVIGHLWKSQAGTIKLTGNIGYKSVVSIVPQRPYFITGLTSLADQIYLSISNKHDHAEILELMSELGLLELTHRFGSVDTKASSNWYGELTPGEAQRLAIVRVLHYKPLLVFLDEATSQLDVVNERKAYEALARRDITVVSVGHRQSIKQFHSVEIHINGDTSYCVSGIGP
ncbi:lysosomal cobalamin transporter ABCD4-like isoform X1 [Watersipora subatra]|uniref:lysosomal cobalamin transporter ABCD4-like isoform X1 n=1 Tax=Watersipora subatra TaxID=2589382 RepID=UPI00355B9BB5